MQCLFIKLYRIPAGVDIVQATHLLNVHLVDAVKKTELFHEADMEVVQQKDRSNIVLITWAPTDPDRSWGTFHHTPGGKSPLQLLDEVVATNVTSIGFAKELYCGYDFVPAA
jgi:hypothetical protein